MIPLDIFVEEKLISLKLIVCYYKDYETLCLK